LRWWPSPLSDSAVALQTLQGKKAKSQPKAEYISGLRKIISAARVAWAARLPDIPFRQCKFMADCPSIHRLTREEKEQLVLPGFLLESSEQLCNVSRYSGDLMQCIEHTHAIICQKWWKERFRYGWEPDPEALEASLRNIFWHSITSKSVSHNVDKLWKLVEYLVHTNTGEYAPQKYV
jgi:hypothetical protein